jgi:iron complex outermembrane receptor protein
LSRYGIISFIPQLSGWFMLKSSLSLSLLALSTGLLAQEVAPEIPDSTRVLQEVIIQGYNYNRPLLEVPAAISTVNQRDLQRFGNTSILPAVNNITGVRMEERSPGSYRLSIRGSSLRSPFGVRNVKVYLNGLPFTDPGGNTYLNLIDFNQVGGFEVIKGPGSSLYGAGTGGVLLLQNPSGNKSEASISAVSGSYGTFSTTLKASTVSAASSISSQYTHFQSDGYRKQTALTRDAFQSQAEFDLNKSTITANILYADLMYETPGGLTLQQYEDDPRQARPAAGPNPGATEQHAAIFNKTFFIGMTHRYEWNEHWSNQTGVYSSLTNFKNPAIRNFERRAEQSFGGRTTTTYQFEKGKINFGAEYQHGFSPIHVYDNNQGTTGNLQYADEIGVTTYFAFLQAEIFLPADFFLTAGASVNKLNVDFERLSITPAVQQDRGFKTVISPRVALLKKISATTSVYASVNHGYSPPTIQELYPSTGVFDQSLKPEVGKNYEAGFRGNFLNKTLKTELVAYVFNLDNTIVVRRTEAGADYFVNAGKTNQHGLESKVEWIPDLKENRALSFFKLLVSYTNNHYTFKNYTKILASSDSANLSGNHLTGIPPHVFVAGVDVAFHAGFYSNITLNFTDEIPLNDENTAYANGYLLLGGKAGFKKQWKHFLFDVFAGVDNALDETYSLGNDLNALGGRFYNAAPGVNFYAGLKAGWVF